MTAVAPAAMGDFLLNAMGRWRSLRALAGYSSGFTVLYRFRYSRGVISSRRTKALIKWLVV